MKAQGTFDVKVQPQSDSGPTADSAIGRMTLDKQFQGDLAGTSKGQMLTGMTAIKNSAGYVAIERFTGSLGGRQGSFILMHTGTMTRGAPTLIISVVPDSGTEQLTGLTGSMEIIIEGKNHSYRFEYSLPAQG